MAQKHYMYDYSALRGLIIEKFETFTNFAVAVNTRTPFVSSHLKSKHPFNQQTIDEWVEVLGIEPNMIGYYFFRRK